MINLTFLGGAGSIGASSTLVEVDGYTAVVDCGVRFTKQNPLPALDNLAGLSVDAIFVTHAHSDHTGGLPILHSDYPAAPLYMTPPTMDLVRVLQADALKIMAAEEKESELPLYNEQQVESMLRNIYPVHFYEKVTAGPLSITYLPASHILGAAMIHMETPYGNILFTGDFSVTPQKTVPGLQLPELKTDLLITETTYGNRLHSDRKAAEQSLIDSIGETINEGGKVLIPAFAIGRAQEVLTILRQAIHHKRLPKIPVYVDGMIRQVCNVYADHPRYVSRYIARQSRMGHAFYDKNIVRVDPKNRRDIVSGKSCVIVSSSGMLSGGPSAYYASKLAQDEKSSIIITGYQDEESPGRALQKAINAPASERFVEISGKSELVRCNVKSYSLSAHADKYQILSIVDRLQPKTVVLVHGDDQAKLSLSQGLTGIDVISAKENLKINRAYPKIRQPHNSQTIRFNRSILLSLSESSDEPVSIHILAEKICLKKVPENSLPKLEKLILETGIYSKYQDTDLLAPSRTTDENRSDMKKDVLTEEDTNLIARNPKGKIFELCMKAKIAPPELSREDKGNRHFTHASVQIKDKKIVSDTFDSTHLRLSSQRSFADLLNKTETMLTSLAESHSSPGKTLISNPKSFINEYCQKNGLDFPIIHETFNSNGTYTVQASLTRGSENLRSKEHTAKSKKDAEKQAFYDLAERISNAKNFKTKQSDKTIAEDFKSQLFVFCSQNKIAPPEFNIATDFKTGKFLATGSLSAAGHFLESKEFFCHNHKSGHQLVSQDLLAKVKMKFRQGTIQ